MKECQEQEKGSLNIRLLTPSGRRISQGSRPATGRSGPVRFAQIRVFPTRVSCQAFFRCLSSQWMPPQLLLGQERQNFLSQFAHEVVPRSRPSSPVVSRSMNMTSGRKTNVLQSRPPKTSKSQGAAVLSNSCARILQDARDAQVFQIPRTANLNSAWKADGSPNLFRLKGLSCRSSSPRT